MIKNSFKAALAGVTALGAVTTTNVSNAADLPKAAPVYNKAPVIPQQANFDVRWGRLAKDFVKGGMIGVTSGLDVQYNQKDQTFNQVGTAITTYSGCQCVLDESGFSVTNGSSSVSDSRLVKGAWIGGLIGGGVYTGIDFALLTFGIDKERMDFVPKAGIEIVSSALSGGFAAMGSRQWGGLPSITNTFQNPSFAVCAPCGGITPTYLGEGVLTTAGKRMSAGKAFEYGAVDGLAWAGLNISVDSITDWSRPQVTYRAAGMSYKAANNYGN